MCELSTYGNAGSGGGSYVDELDGCGVGDVDVERVGFGDDVDFVGDGEGDVRFGESPLLPS